MNDIKGIIEDVEKSSLVSDKVIEKVIEIIGQEKWQDINDKKSDICTTTGELIITLKGIPYLEKENAELKRDKEDLIFVRNQNAKCMCEDKDQLTKAKELLKNIIKVTWGEGWNYSLDWKVKAEQFLKEIEE